MQKLAGDHSATARIDVLKGDTEYQVRVMVRPDAEPGEDNLQVRSSTPSDAIFSFDGYTFFPPNEGVPSPYSTGEFTNVIINASRGWMPSTMHHELRHVLIGDFGRQVPIGATHGTGTVDQETREAEKEAVKNHLETLK